MAKRKVLLTALFFAIVVMVLAINTFAIGSTKVSVKVKTATSEINTTTTIAELFNYTQSSGSVKVTGLKNFGSYTVDALREIHIPAIITEVNFTGAYSKITSLVIDDYCSVKLTNIKSLSGLKKIKVGYGSTTFGASGMPSTVETLEIGGVNGVKGSYTFQANSFDGCTNLKTIKFDARNTYDFGQYAFRNTGITELNLVDGATFKFSGTGVFSGCSSLKNIYAGNGVTALNQSVFENCYSLEKAVLMEVINLYDNAFAITNAGTEKAKLRVYVHAAKSTSFGSNTFKNRNGLGVICCAIMPNITSFSNCKFDLLYGVQHDHTPIVVEPTCVLEGANTYTTDCSCGKVKNAVYKHYRSGTSNYTLVEMFTTAIPVIPHEFTDVHNMEYDNGINNPGIIEYACSMCSTREGVDKIANPVVDFPGYSVFQGGTKAMVIGVRFNPITLAQYEEKMGVSLEYGIVLASKNVLNGQNPLKANGDAYSDKVYVYDMKANGHYDSILKLSGLGNNTMSMEFAFASYIKIGDEIVYIDNGGVSNSITYVSYNSLIK